MTITFDPNQASVRRWIFHDLELAALRVHQSDGAAFSLAVSIDGGALRVRDVNGGGGAQSIIDRAQAAQRGLAIAHLSLGDDEPLNEVSGRVTQEMEAEFFIELPPTSAWNDRRAEDVADAIDRDLIRAVMHDRRRNGLAIVTRHAGGGAVVVDPDLQVIGFSRKFVIQYRHAATDAQQFAPAGLPDAPMAHDVFVLWRDATPDGEVTEVESATAMLGGGQLTLRTVGVAPADPLDPTVLLPAPEIIVNLPLAEHTVQSLIDAVDGEIGWHADPLTVDAGALAAPADDLATFPETNALGVGSAITVEIEA